MVQESSGGKSNDQGAVCHSLGYTQLELGQGSLARLCGGKKKTRRSCVDDIMKKSVTLVTLRPRSWSRKTFLSSLVKSGQTELRGMRTPLFRITVEAAESRKTHGT